MISIVLFLFIVIICVIWNLFIEEQLRKRNNKLSIKSYNCRIEARKNLSNKI